MRGSQQHVATGIVELDAALGGGLPKFSTTLVAGRPGTGKTILALQAAFNVASRAPDSRALYFATLGESRAKLIRHAQEFAYFDADVFGERLAFEDLGAICRHGTLAEALEIISEAVNTRKAELIVVDSFRALRDLARTSREFRIFTYDLAERLNAGRCTALLLGEYARRDWVRSPELAVVDGILRLVLTQQASGPARRLEVVKLRGREADLVPRTFSISQAGIHVKSPHDATSAPTDARIPSQGYPKAWTADGLIARTYSAYTGGT